MAISVCWLQYSYNMNPWTSDLVNACFNWGCMHFCVCVQFFLCVCVKQLLYYLLFILFIYVYVFFIYVCVYLL